MEEAERGLDWMGLPIIATVIHRGEQWSKPEKSAKTLPTSIERRVFADTRITAYRLAA